MLTLNEFRQTESVTVLGVIGGCIACLFWPLVFPLFIVLTAKTRRMNQRNP
jgi:hypothetical protein